MGSFGGLYELATFLLGSLPQEWSFLYYLFACLLGIGLVFVLFSPIVLLYEIIGVKK